MINVMFLSSIVAIGLFFCTLFFSLLISLTALPFIFSFAGGLREWVDTSGVTIPDLFQAQGVGGTLHGHAVP